MKIGLLILDQANKTKAVSRSSFCKRTKNNYDSYANTGFRRIIQDVHKKYTPEYCWISDIGKYDYVLCSLTSPLDYENLVYTFEKYNPQRNGCKMVVGGSGSLNVKLISGYIDIACFGRGENQIVDILEGRELENVWRKDKDPGFKKVYTLRQFDSSVRKGFEFVGCRNKCYFCGYTWHRKKNYSETGHFDSGGEVAGREDDWRGLEILDGKAHTTAIDGLTEKSRFLANKRISDRDIIEKILELYDKNIKTRISLKMYCIIGYPWETQVKRDFEAFFELIKSVDLATKKMDLKLAFCFFPFCPTPLTPMQYMPANIEVNWWDEINSNGKFKIYDGRNITAFYNNHIEGPVKLIKRLFAYRGRVEDIESFKKIIFTGKLKTLSQLKTVNLLRDKGFLPDHIYQEIDEGQSSFEYLRTYADVKKLGRRLQRKLKEQNHEICNPRRICKA